jgi:quinolinate synthase
MAQFPVTIGDQGTVSEDAKSRYEEHLIEHETAMSQLPERYQGLDESTVKDRIEETKAELGDDVLVLVHNYQNRHVYEFADFSGDSFKLSKRAANVEDAEHVVFCGVSFMAETADLLTEGEKNVVLPSMEASCPMAGMAEMVQVADGWEGMCQHIDPETTVPVTYMNSYADLKAFTGERGGTICTSSNAELAFEWAFDRGETVVFFPDKHLGYNTARDMGIPDDEIVFWNPWAEELGGVDADDLASATVVLWEGYCQVHDRFQPKHVENIREEHPDAQVVVHPECRRSVLEMADFVGSTSQITEHVEDQPAGSTIAIGTEIHMVERLDREHPDKEIVQVCGDMCMDCNAMRQIQPEYLLWNLEEIADGNVPNRIVVDDEDRPGALAALERMLEL